MSLGEFSKIAASLLCLFSISVAAKEVEKINFADELTLEKQKLVLNGAGLRTKRKLGMNFRVYVGGLYLVKKSEDAKAVIASDNPKVLRLVLLRSVDKDTMQEAMKEGFEKNCKIECDKMKDKIAAYNELMVPLKEGSEITMTFEKDGVRVDSKGKESKAGKVDGAAFSKNLLATFIGDEPPTVEFKTALMGK